VSLRIIVANNDESPLLRLTWDADHFLGAHDVMSCPESLSRCDGNEEKWRNYTDENAESAPKVNIWKIAKAQSISKS
jgi:hypothetical protein